MSTSDHVPVQPEQPSESYVGVPKGIWERVQAVLRRIPSVYDDATANCHEHNEVVTAKRYGYEVDAIATLRGDIAAAQIEEITVEEVANGVLGWSGLGERKRTARTGMFWMEEGHRSGLGHAATALDALALTSQGAASDMLRAIAAELRAVSMAPNADILAHVMRHAKTVLAARADREVPHV